MEGEEHTVERFVYAEGTAEQQQLNLCGHCIHHYDTAGLHTLASVALTGQPLRQHRQVLHDIEAPVNWTGDNTAWQSLLAPPHYTTDYTYDATGEVLTQTDAKGHRQRLAYNIVGQLCASWLTLHRGDEQTVVKSLSYSAAGQTLREESGNGVVTAYTYEPETQRLLSVKTTRSTPLKILQHLRYDYDPVGNILAIHNDAEKTRFYLNQRIAPENTYYYDALYQLIRATGRSSTAADTAPTISALPPLDGDNSQYVNYTRHYTYDRSGNLTQIRHASSATRYTTAITVAAASNHAVLAREGLTPKDVEHQFDRAGNPKNLQPGQSLTWNTRHQLQHVAPITREGQQNDQEHYLYEGGGMRIIKQSRQLTGNTTHTQRVIYLPGLELRTQSNGQRDTEVLQVITIGAAGRAQVRVLHWEQGRPPGIANATWRYSVDNQIGSSQLELDGEGKIISQEEYFPYGGTALWASRSTIEAAYKTVRYSGKERDATGLYYYGYRYYQPWLGRWLNPDPAGTVDGLNLYKMVRNNPIVLFDVDGRMARRSNKVTNSGKNSNRTARSPRSAQSSVSTTVKEAAKVPSLASIQSSNNYSDRAYGRAPPVQQAIAGLSKSKDQKEPSSKIENKKGKNISHDYRINMHMDNKHFNGQPLYVHYTSLEGYKGISDSKMISNRPNTERRGAQAKKNVYLTGTALNTTNAHMSLFLGEEKYKNSATYSFIFTFNGSVNLEGEKVSEFGSDSVYEYRFPNNIRFRNINILYHGENPFN